MTSSPCLNPFKNTEAKLPNWVCSTNIPRLGGNPFLVLRPDGMLRRIADPCQAQLRSHKLDSTSEAPKIGFYWKQSSWIQFTHR